MSKYKITNTTNSRSNTLANTLAPGSQSITGYRQSLASITSTSLVNSTIESVTTRYKYQSTDIGNSYCAIYNDYAGPSSGTIPVSNYSKCTIVMCGGGGGGGGGQGAILGTNKPGGNGGNGGITIIENVPVSSVTTITYSVGTGGSGGIGEQSIPKTNSLEGGSGNATNVVVSSTTYTANGGGGGSAGQPVTPGTEGNINPTSQTYPSANLNGPLTYQTTPDRIINISSTNYGQGGNGGNRRGPSDATAGQVGNPGYLRIYFYP